MANWINKYIDNSGLDNQSNELSFCNALKGFSRPQLTLAEWTKQVIRECAAKEVVFTESNFKKLRFIIVDEFFCDDIIGLTRRNDNENYKYFIFITKDAVQMDESSFKNRIAHELAHYLFKLLNRNFGSYV